MKGLLIAYPLTLLLAHYLQHLLPKELRPTQLSWRLYLLQTVIITTVYLLALAISLRPYLAAILTLACLVVLLIINQAKHHALREPLVFSDVYLYLQVVRHPRLFLPFLNMTLVMGSILVGLCLLYFVVQTETSLLVAAHIQPALLFALLLLTAGYCIYLIQRLSAKLALTFEAPRDVQTLGFYNSLIVYTLQARSRERQTEFQKLIAEQSPFKTCTNPSTTSKKARQSKEENLANIIIIQSESFFDPRPMWPSINKDILQYFDKACAESIVSGELKVPAWGANTLRTEFAFLSGIPNQELKHYRFNPYQYLQKSLTPTLASHLKSKGYHCIAIHPNEAEFFGRNKVFPLLGFDEFIDIHQFDKNDTDGPYISDAAVARKINATLDKYNDQQPLFIFVITMENHGPLHLENVALEDVNTFYQRSPPTHHHDLSVYLRHLSNTDRMLQEQLYAHKNKKRATILSFYGDHVPSMPILYDQLNFSNGQTKFLIWSNTNISSKQHGETSAAAPDDTEELRVQSP